MTRKITATHNGAIFIRRTERIYSHAIIGRRDLAALSIRSQTSAEFTVRYDWPCILKVAAGTSRLSAYTRTEDRGRAIRLVEMGLDAAVAQARKAVADHYASLPPPSFEALAWVNRPDLAAAQIKRWSRPKLCWIDVMAVPVDEPDKKTVYERRSERAATEPGFVFRGGQLGFSFAEHETGSKPGREPNGVPDWVAGKEAEYRAGWADAFDRQGQDGHIQQWLGNRTE